MKTETMIIEGKCENYLVRIKNQFNPEGIIGL
jgi:hypothetical protein